MDSIFGRTTLEQRVYFMDYIIMIVGFDIAQLPLLVCTCTGGVHDSI